MPRKRYDVPVLLMLLRVGWRRVQLVLKEDCLVRGGVDRRVEVLLDALCVSLATGGDLLSPGPS